MASRKQSPGQEDGSLITRAIVRRLYDTVLRHHLVADRTAELLRARRLPLDIGPAGLEAVEAGVCYDLLPQDLIIPAPRSLSARLTRGETLADFFRELFLPPQNGRRRVLASPLDLRDRLAVVAGAALAIRDQQPRRVAVLFAEESGPALSDAREILSFAARHRLPAIFVLYSEHAIDGLPPASEITGVPVLPVDRNDAVAIYRVAHEAILRARQGDGPAVIHCEPYCPHQRRGKALCKDCDPLAALQNNLTLRDAWSDRHRDKVTAAVRRELARATAPLAPRPRSKKK